MNRVKVNTSEYRSYAPAHSPCSRCPALFDDWFSDPARKYPKDFIEFCRAGEFIVLDEYKAEEKDLEASLTE